MNKQEKLEHLKMSFIKLKPLFSKDYLDALKAYNRLKKNSLLDWKRKIVEAEFIYLVNKLLPRD